MKSYVVLTILMGYALLSMHAQMSEDPFLWLEEVEGKRALEWVETQNEETLSLLEQNEAYPTIFNRTVDILNSKDRIVYPTTRGEYVYNFWQDETYPRGVWRRMPKGAFYAGKTNWTVLIDLKALSEAEGENWVYKGTTFLEEESSRCLVSLSRGGSDAVEVREFDVDELAFVEEGFVLPQSKGGVSWLDEETVLAARDFGEGSMTTSGYPRIIKLWKRGTDLSEAETIFEGQTTDVNVAMYRPQPHLSNRHIIRRGIDFFHAEKYLYDKGELIPLDIPLDVNPTFFQDYMLLELKEDWAPEEAEAYPGGSLIAIKFEAFLEGERTFEMIVNPRDRETIRGISATKDVLLVNMLSNVVSELYEYTLQDDGWGSRKVETPAYGTINIGDASELRSEYLLSYANYLQPTTLYRVASPGSKPAILQQLPAYFDASSLTVNQHEATSKDGTKIPYFIVHPKDIQLDGRTPTLLYGYGGFNISLTPGYNAVTGANWLEAGYAYVVANIRGGGEFGAPWHRAALKENRQRAYDDFIAVAEDLIDRGITSPEHLGIQGGSNGGLLVGATYTQRPDLFNAVACTVPLLDMKRYHKMLAGASWIGEYGNPDVPEEWAYIKAYSPYQNLVADQQYPRVLFVTTTRDDRVHPGHARKMAAKMQELGHDMLYFENTEGGHGAGVTNDQRARFTTVITTYLIEQLAH